MPTGGFCPNLPKKKSAFPHSYIFLPTISCLRHLSATLRNHHANGWILPELAQEKSTFRPSHSCRPFSVFAVCPARFGAANRWFLPELARKWFFLPTTIFLPFILLSLLTSTSNGRGLAKTVVVGQPGSPRVQHFGNRAYTIIIHNYRTLSIGRGGIVLRPARSQSRRNRGRFPAATGKQPAWARRFSSCPRRATPGAMILDV